MEGSYYYQGRGSGLAIFAVMTCWVFGSFSPYKQRFRVQNHWFARSRILWLPAGSYLSCRSLTRSGSDECFARAVGGSWTRDSGFWTGNSHPVWRGCLAWGQKGLGGSNRAEKKAEKRCADPEIPERWNPFPQNPHRTWSLLNTKLQFLVYFSVVYLSALLHYYVLPCSALSLWVSVYLRERENCQVVDKDPGAVMLGVQVKEWHYSSEKARKQKSHALIGNFIVGRICGEGVELCVSGGLPLPKCF